MLFVVCGADCDCGGCKSSHWVIVVKLVRIEGPGIHLR